MNLLEHEGRQLFLDYGLPVPEGTVVSTKEELEQFAGSLDTDEEYVIKAQVHVGGRGKAGGVKFATRENMVEVGTPMLGMNIKGFVAKQLMIAKKLSIEQEFYLGCTLNRSDRNITLLFSREGGVDIEEVAHSSPEKIVRVPLTTYDEDAVKQALAGEPLAEQLLPFVRTLHKIFLEKDASLVEINPLALCGDKLIAADAKVTIDENALYRQDQFKQQEDAEKSDLEKKAASWGLQYVELDGDIAIIGNGAGLVMATLDVINHFGGSAANFLDVGGGASVEVMEKSLEVVMMKPGLKGIFINIFGGITRCDEIAKGLVNYAQNHEMLPLVVRMTGTNDKEGIAVLQQGNIESFDSMDECAKKIVEMVR